jgi:hypothetical protein
MGVEFPPPADLQIKFEPRQPVTDPALASPSTCGDDQLKVS